jgi:Tol biopolymer transport system component
MLKRNQVVFLAVLMISWQFATFGQDQPVVSALSVPGGRVDWSNARSMLAFDKFGADGYHDVYTMRPNGSDVQCLTCGKPGIPQLHNGNPSWHPSGNYIVFQSQDPGLAFPPPQQSQASILGSPGYGTHNNLWLMSSDGSQFWQLTTIAAGMATLHPQFSSGGLYLLWAERIGVIGTTEQWTLKLSRLVWTEGVPTLQNTFSIQPLGINLFYESHGFSPDGRKILFSAGFENGDTTKPPDIYQLDLVSGTLQNLTNSPNEYDEHAHYTPSGGKIVWSSSRGITKVRNFFIPFLDYWVMDSTGANPRRLTYFNEPSSPGYYQNGIQTGDFAFGPTSQHVFSKLELDGIPQLNVLEVTVAIILSGPL